MYRNYLEVKKNINSLRWGKEEKVTDTISRKRLINDGAKGYSYKYYMNSNPNTYVVMSSGKSPYVLNNVTADATAFGVKNGVATKTVDYLNNDYTHREDYFRDSILDKLGNTAIKDFKLKFERKKNRESESVQKYNKTLDKEFIGKLKPELVKAAKERGVNLKNFEISVKAGGIFPSIKFNLDDIPVYIDTDHKSGGEKYFSYLYVGDPKDEKEERRFHRYDKIAQELAKVANRTYKERTKNLVSDPNGRLIRTIIKAKKEKEGYQAKAGSASRLQYEDYEPNYFPY